MPCFEFTKFCENSTIIFRAEVLPCFESISNHYFENKKLSTDTLNIELASNSGRWYGKGKSDIREFVAENYTAPKTYSKGTYNVELESDRQNCSTRVENLGTVGWVPPAFWGWSRWDH